MKIKMMEKIKAGMKMMTMRGKVGTTTVMKTKWMKLLSKR